MSFEKVIIGNAELYCGDFLSDNLASATAVEVVLGDSQYSKYSAACHSSFQFNRSAIESALGVV